MGFWVNKKDGLNEMKSSLNERPGAPANALKGEVMSLFIYTS